MLPAVFYDTLYRVDESSEVLQVWEPAPSSILGKYCPPPCRITHDPSQPMAGFPIPTPCAAVAGTWRRKGFGNEANMYYLYEDVAASEVYYEFRSFSDSSITSTVTVVHNTASDTYTLTSSGNAIDTLSVSPTFGNFTVAESKEEWERVTPPGRAGHATAMLGGVFLIWGGHDSSSIRSDVWAFSVDTGKRCTPQTAAPPSLANPAVPLLLLPLLPQRHGCALILRRPLQGKPMQPMRCCS